MCAVLVLLCLLNTVSPLRVDMHKISNTFCAFSGWVPPEGYVPRRLRNEATDAANKAPDTCKSVKTLRAPFRPWRQGIPWRQDRFHSVARTREVLNNSTVVAVASLMQDTKHENKRLQQEINMQRQEIANLRTHMSALSCRATGTTRRATKDTERD